MYSGLFLLVMLQVNDVKIYQRVALSELFFIPFTSESLQKQSPEVFCAKGVLRYFTKITRKRLCQSLFFNKVAGLRPTTLLKKRLWHSCFPVNFVKFLRTSFFTEHIWTTASKPSIWCLNNEMGRK